MIAVTGILEHVAEPSGSRMSAEAAKPLLGLRFTESVSVPFAHVINIPMLGVTQPERALGE